MGQGDRGALGGVTIRRHRLSTRVWHWLSAALLTVLLMSGLMIFNAHPRLYWGSYGANPDPAWLEIGAEDDRGYLRVGAGRVTTTGALGLWTDAQGRVQARAFPGWATLPGYYDLAGARRWHLSAAWVFAAGTLIFGGWSLFNGHLRHDLLPRARELVPGHIARQLWDHACLRLPCGEEAACYNTLQKLVYLGVTAGLIPLVILTGLTMSPWVVAQAPVLLDIFGGRQSARSLHFLAAGALVGFVALHLVMVLIAGPWNELRSMITGRFRLPPERER